MNKQQQFISALFHLVQEYDVEINGEFTVWPADAPEGAKPILAEINSVNPQEILLRPRAARQTPKPWTEQMAAAYAAGCQDAKSGVAHPENANGFDACYWQGWSHQVPG